MCFIEVRAEVCGDEPLFRYPTKTEYSEYRARPGWAGLGRAGQKVIGLKVGAVGPSIETVRLGIQAIQAIGSVDIVALDEAWLVMNGE